MYTKHRGTRKYEGVNHLGNVLVVYSDKRLNQCSTSTVLYYKADVLVATNYSPFGVSMKQWYPGGDTGAYRFGFNGKEADNETYGTGNIYDYGLRIYNPRLGRFLSVDPLANEYAWNSTYAFAENDVIKSIDLDGAEKLTVIVQPYFFGTKPMLRFTIIVDDEGKPLSTNYIYKDFSGGVINEKAGTAIDNAVLMYYIESKCHVYRHPVGEGAWFSKDRNVQEPNVNNTHYKQFEINLPFASPIDFMVNGSQTTITQNVTPLPPIPLNIAFNPAASGVNPGAFADPAAASIALDNFVASLPAGTTNVDVTVGTSLSPTDPVAAEAAAFGITNPEQLVAARGATIQAALATRGINATVKTVFNAAIQVTANVSGGVAVSWTVTQTPVQIPMQLNPDGTTVQNGAPIATGPAASTNVTTNPGPVGTKVTPNP